MVYRLGVDLGTTFTAAAVAEDGSATMLGLGDRALQIPSVLYLLPGGGVLVGEPAARRALVDPSRTVREFKRRIGDQVPLLVDGTPYSPQSLTARLLRWVVDLSAERLGEPPKPVVLTYPANWGQYKRDLLGQAAAIADVGDTEYCPEPQAAAVQYAAKAGVEAGDRIAVYDLGGGTFDVCLLEKTAQGFEILGTPDGIEHLGGIDFDEAVFRHVLAVVHDRAGLDTDDPAVTAGLARLRRDCVEAKESLSSDVDAIVPVSLPGTNISVRLTRSELEAMIEPALEDTHTVTRRAIRSAGLNPEDLRAVVLVGGSSRIPLVGERLMQALGIRLARDIHPKHDIALGAVQMSRPVATAEPAIPASAPVAPPVFVTAQPVSAPAPPPVFAPGASPTSAPVPPHGASVRRLPSWRLLLVGMGAILGVLLVALSVLNNQGSLPASAPLDNRSFTPAAPTLDNTSSLPASIPLRNEQLVIPENNNGNFDLWVVNARTRQKQTRLTNSDADDFSPTISPDRRTVIYVRDPDANDPDDSPTLRVMAADGSGDRRLFRSTPRQCEAAQQRPAWQKTNPLLAVPCEGKRGRWSLYVVSIDGKVLRELPTGQQRVDDPTFAPDGRTLAYWAGPASEPLGGSLYTIATDGQSDPQKVTTQQDTVSVDPAWSPDGNRIAYSSRPADADQGGNVQDGVYDIFLVEMVNNKWRGPSRITFGGGDDMDASWSPDGDMIAFRSDTQPGDRPGRQQYIWRMTPTGDERAPLVLTASHSMGTPAWSSH